jgi:CRISPR-associated protein Cas5
MIFGMIENLLSFHFSPEIRSQIEKWLKKENKKSFNGFVESGSGYKSILSNHVKIEHIEKPTEITTFEDLWSQQLKRSDNGHLKGARNYDWRLEQQLDTLEEKLQTQYYPYYYISPTNREYILCKGSYSIALKTNKELAQRIREGLSNLHTPLYLGSNDGWIEVKAGVSDEKL